MEASLGAAAWEGFQLVFAWPNILYPTIATLAAMGFSFVPGLSSVTLLALAVTLTISWDPLHVMLVFGALTGGATFMGSITAILFNIPGSASNAATMIDGHPMAQQGRARTAIACSAASSALGSTIGIGAFILLLPFLRQLILSFGPAEFLMLAIWGLATIGLLTGRSILKGISAALLGILLATVGLDQATAQERFTFGLLDLQDGFALVPVVLGIFAIAEMLQLTTRTREAVADRAELAGGVKEGLLAPFRNLGLLIRSSITGTVVGMIPAVGAIVAGFLAYGQAVQSARDRSRFGKGDIRGVLAPEAAHDAKDGGSLAPTLALGIPGSEGAAVLLVALTVHGLIPGRELLSQQLPLVFVLVWSLFYSNWLTSILGLALTTPLSRASFMPAKRLAPLILVFASVGAFAHRGRFSDVVIAFLFGIGGFFLKRNGWPRIPLVTALVLGPLFETNLRLTLGLEAAGRLNFFSRPLIWILLGLIILTAGWPRLREGLHRP